MRLNWLRLSVCEHSRLCVEASTILGAVTDSWNSKTIEQRRSDSGPRFDGSSLNMWWVMAWTSSKWGKFGFSSWIWSWRSGSIAPKNNRDLNQVLLHLLSKFNGSSLNTWWFMARTSSGLTDTHTDRHTHRQTDRQTQATTIPEGQNWPRVKIEKINWRTELKKTLEFGVLYAKGVFVFIYKEWWMQLAKYPSVSWRVLSITIR